MEGLIHKRHLVGEEGQRLHSRHGLDARLAGQDHQQIEAVGRWVVGDDVIEGTVLGERFGDELLLVGRHPQSQQRAAVAVSDVGAMFLGQQLGHQVEVAAESRVGGDVQKGSDLWSLLSAVAVDAAVALLDGDEAPQHIDVDEVMALPVKVDALGGDIAGQEQPQRGVGQGELLDDILLAHVGQAAMQDTNGWRLETQESRQRALQPAQGGVALREQHRSCRGPCADPDLLQFGDEGGQLGAGVIGDGAGQIGEVFEGDTLVGPLGGPVIVGRVGRGSCGALRRSRSRHDGMTGTP